MDQISRHKFLHFVANKQIRKNDEQNGFKVFGLNLDGFDTSLSEHTRPYFA